VKFLIDSPLPPLVAEGFRRAGIDATHVRDLGLQSAEDEDIFSLAIQENRVLVSADTDFGTLLALRSTNKPSLILFRRGAEYHPSKQLSLILTNLNSIQSSLEQGCIVVFEKTRIRIRPLPIDMG